MRIAAILEYDGARFAGWQWQAPEHQAPRVRTVQAEVEAAFSRIANAPVRVVVAGRTDAGVHACAQVIHFDTEARRTPVSWVRGANTYLPREIAIVWADEIDPKFHARFSATGRRYRYVILNRGVRPSLLAARVTWEYRRLDVEAMQAAADSLLGTHDFSAYRAVQCQAKSPVRELRALDVRRRGELVVIDVYANAFLHHMVRNLAGVLLTIGAGERGVGWAREVLETRDRTQGGITAPPDGLYLSGIEYPSHFGIPSATSPCGPA